MTFPFDIPEDRQSILNKWTCILTITFIIGLLASSAYAQPETKAPEHQLVKSTDKSGDFVYDLPEGWRKLEVSQSKHDVLLLPQVDRKNRTVIVNDQPGPGPLEDIARKYERDLPKALKDFKLVSSDIVSLADDHRAVRIIHTNSQPGVRVRQINYIIDIKGKYYFIAYTGMDADGETHDEAVAKFVASIGPAE